VERGGCRTRQAFLATQRLDASAGPVRVVPVVAEVVDHPAQVRRGAVHPEVARPVAAKVCQAVAMAAVRPVL
jgi:hypothetical protein